MRIVLKILLIVVLLIVVAAGGAIFYLNRIAKTGIERGSEYALGVPTTVGSVGIGLLRGEIAVHELRIANPAGYEEPYFLQIGSFDFHMPPRNVLEQTVEVRLVSLDAISLDIERKKKQSNYGTILDGLKKFESSEPSQSEEAGSSKQFIVRELTITNVAAKLRQEVVAGQGAAITVNIPEIRLRDIGSNSGGVTMGELTGIVTKALLDAVTKAGGVPSAILGDLTGSLKGLGHVAVELPAGVGTATQAAGDLTTELGGKAGKEVGKALKGIGGLFGGSEKEREP